MLLVLCGIAAVDEDVVQIDDIDNVYKPNHSVVDVGLEGGWGVS